MDRRGFLGGVFGFVATANAATPASQLSSAPLVWPAAAPLQAKIRSFHGHTDTVLDVIGRIGTPASLVIFTEGNHLMVLLSSDIGDAFLSWAKSHRQYADLDLTNIVIVTLPQPILLEMVRTGAVALGNLTLEVSRSSGFYPDIFMGYPEPLRELRRLRVIGPEARFFCKNRGVALLVRKGNPHAIHALPDVVRAGLQIALPDAGDVRAKCRAAADDLLGEPAANALFAAEVQSFPGRLGIMHRDLPEMIARGYADVAFTWRHLVSYWAQIFPNQFEFIEVRGAEPYFTQIAFGSVEDPLRPRALKAFDEFFFSRARDVYPQFDFARMNDNEYGATLALD
jgi:hypothetical protein